MSTQPKSSSIFTAPITSSQKADLPPPLPPVGNTKKTNTQPRMQELPVFSRSKDQTVDPVISNNDIFRLITQVKHKMDEQVETNKTIFKEIEGIKRSKISANEDTPLIPKMLNFNSLGFSNAQNQGSSAMFLSGSSVLRDQEFTNNFSAGNNISQSLGSSILNPSGSAGLHTTNPFLQEKLKSTMVNSSGATGWFPPTNLIQQGPGSSVSYPQGSSMLAPFGSKSIYSQGTSGGSSEYQDDDVIPMQTEATPYFTHQNNNFWNKDPISSTTTHGLQFGNHLNTAPFNTNQAVFQGAGASTEVSNELKRLKDMISSVPGIVKPIAEVPVGSHKLSRFKWPICDVVIPKRFQTPNMKLYDGSTDPEEHVAQYRERMEVNPIPIEIKEACLCKGFGSTLTGPALKWLLSIPPNTISSFSHLINMFNNQFSCSRAFEKMTGDLYRITQKSNESLRDYIIRFSRESLEIPNLDMAAAVEAFKLGMDKDNAFYDDLVMVPCRNLDEVRSRALRFIRLEDDKKINRRIDVPKYEHTSRKYDSPQKNYRKPYNKQDSPKINAIEEDEEEEYPKISDYCFSVDTPSLICALQDLGEKARWPKKNVKPNPGAKDKSKWCAFHEDFGHNTDECIALRKEISYLLSKGHLKELLNKRKGNAKDTSEVPERAPSPPHNAKVVNFISGGSDICGTSYSAAKRNAKEAKLENGERPVRTSTQTGQKTISFEDKDRCNIQDPHHDSLVITLSIANCFVRRILIDGGSSVNIIQLDALRKMDIPDSEIIPRSSVLVGFSGETKNTLGDIKLPVYIEGVNSFQKFCVIDSLSCCNVILGRPWIHDMKAVPSTYHQCVKLPSPWGIIKIESDQQDAKNCYTSSMKPAAKSTTA